MALVITYLVIAYSLVMILKSLFGLPQASDTYQLIDIIPDEDPRGFPSSAAAVATAVYVGMVYELDLGRKRLLGALAGVVVLAVSVSRVALEYHLVGDMIAGVFVGALVIVLIGRTFDENIPRAFVVGLVLSSASFIMVGNLKSIIAAGGALGGLVVSPWITNGTPTVQRRVVLVAVGLAVIVLSLFFQPHVSSSHVLTAGLYAALFATILTLPILLPRDWDVGFNA
jgi:hypothetical protein